jgi:hypothetical protein
MFKAYWTHISIWDWGYYTDPCQNGNWMEWTSHEKLQHAINLLRGPRFSYGLLNETYQHNYEKVWIERLKTTDRRLEEQRLAEQRIAIYMALHPRLGAESPLRFLPRDLLTYRIIIRHFY